MSSPPADRSGSALALLEGMYVGGSLFLIAIGAILYWAVTFQLNGINLHMVGLILMAIGVIGMLFGVIESATTRHRLT